MRPQFESRFRVDHLVFVVGAAMVACKLWLSRGQGLLAIGDSPGDDRLYLELAGELLRTGWLGPYRYLTLAKNPGLPIWVALTFLLDVPLLLSFQLLYAGACWAVVAAVRPALPHRAWGWFLFGFLLWNPASVASQVAGRASREGIYPALALLVFAGCAGVVTRLPTPGRLRLGRWAALLGASTGALALTREEGLWVAPMMAVALAAACSHRPAWRRLAGALGFAGALFLLTVGAVATRNYLSYGEFLLNEQAQGAFPDAWGALSRVRHDQWRRYVPLPRDARARLYESSALFGELKAHLEGPERSVWVAPSCRLAQVCDEVYSGLAFWEVRDAARQAGHFSSGREAARYWSAVANEVNAACDRHALDCLPPRSTLVPPWRSEYWPLLLSALGKGYRSLTRFEDLTARPLPSVGPVQLTSLFADLTHERRAGLDSSRRVLAIRGWAVHQQGSPLELRVTGPGSEPWGEAPVRMARPDVEAWFRTNGWPVTATSGFWLRAYCPDDCSVAVLSGGAEVARLPLKPGQVVESGKVRAAIDDVQVDGALPHQERLDERRVALLERAVRAYRALTPALALAAVAAWVAALLLLWTSPANLPLWLLATGAATGTATRLALLAAVDAVAFPGLNPTYLSAAYSLLVLFIPLGLAAGASAVADRLRRPRAATVTAPAIPPAIEPKAQP